MNKILVAALLIAGCLDSSDPSPPDAGIHLVAPDAAEPADACTREPSGDCCALLPDEDAVRACSIQGLNPGDCGVAVCWKSDCSRVQINFCAPS